MKKKRDIVEIFGFSPTDLSLSVRSYWKTNLCPFINGTCTKINHDQTIVYGTCSVTSPYGDVIICPNRLYANGYKVIKDVAVDAFGDLPFYFYEQYAERRIEDDEWVVALGQNSGKEVQIGRSLSMDWVLVKMSKRGILEYTGIEVQSIDITGNYREAWQFYKNLKPDDDLDNRPSSNHGLNWANVHKRLIPQIIRKGVVYFRSKLVKRGIYFIVPEIVYRKFEDVVGNDIPSLEKNEGDCLTVMTFGLGKSKNENGQKDIVLKRKIRFSLDDFANRFISGPNLPSGEELDNAVKSKLGLDLR